MKADDLKPFTKMFKEVYDALRRSVGLTQKGVPDFSQAYIRPMLTHDWVPLNDETIRQLVAALKAVASRVPEIGRPKIPTAEEWLEAARQQSQDRRPPSARYRTREYQKTPSQLKSPTDKSDLSVVQPPAAINEDKYAEAIKGRYGHVALEVISPTQGHYRNVRLTKVFFPQQVVSCQESLFTLIEMQPKGRRDFGYIRELSRRLGEPPPRSVLNVVDNPAHSQIVILGELGAGKSMLLEFIALRWAESDPQDRKTLPIPLLCELDLYGGFARARREHGLSCDLTNYLCEGAGVFWRLSERPLKERLVSGAVTLLLDGVGDILEPTVQQEVIVEIVRFSREYPSVHVIVTSRLIGYPGELLRRAGFRHFLLQGLEGGEVERFIGKWHREVSEGGDVGRGGNGASILKQAIRDSLQLQELAGNPLLLTVMTLLHAHRPLFKSRFRILQECSQVLLERWKMEAVIRSDPDLREDATAFGLAEKTDMLRLVARQIASQSEELKNILAASALERCIVGSISQIVSSNPIVIARALIRHLRERAGILCQVEGNYFAFVHRAFLEFFCADDLSRQLCVGELKHRSLLRIFEGRPVDHSWQEIRRLLCCVGKPAIIQNVLNETTSASEGDDEELAETILVVADCIRDAPDVREFRSVRRRVLKELLRIVQRSSTVVHPSQSSGAEAPPDPPKQVHRKGQAAQAVVLLGFLGAGNDDVRDRLKMLARQPGDDFLRSLAVCAVARAWCNETQTHDWLKECAAYSLSHQVRRAALTELAQRWPLHENTIAFLKQIAESDLEPIIRTLAVYMIGRECSGSPVTIDWLKRSFMSSGCPDVRATAASVIAENYCENGTVLTWLKRAVFRERDESVRVEILRGIARNWRGAPQLFKWLKSVAISDKDAAIRQTAVRALSNYLDESKPARPLLESRLQRDKDFGVRIAALNGLKYNLRHNPSTISVFRWHAEFDCDWRVREVAVRALVKHCKDDPETLRLVRICAADMFGGLSTVGLKLLRKEWGKDSSACD